MDARVDLSLTRVILEGTKSDLSVARLVAWHSVDRVRK